MSKGVIRCHKLKKERQYNCQKGQTMIYRTLYRNMKVEQDEPHLKQGVNRGAPEW